MIKKKSATLPKGLTRAEALKKMLRKFPGDYRGFSYNAKTGKAEII